MRLRAGEWKHTVTMRSGDVYVGEILDRAVSIKVHGSPTQVPMAKVVWILFANQYGVPQDQVRLVSGTSMSGKVTNLSFRVRLEDEEQVLRLATKDILTIQSMNLERWTRWNLPTGQRQHGPRTHHTELTWGRASGSCIWPRRERHGNDTLDR